MRDKKQALEAILDEEAEPLLRSAITKARAGDSAAIKLLLERVLVRDRLLKIDVPPIASASDLPNAVSHVLGAMGRGEITIGEANGIVALLSGLRQSFETCELAARLEALEQRLHNQ